MSAIVWEETHVGTKMHLVLTACSNRKRYAPDPILSARCLPFGSFQEVSDEWTRRIAAAHPVTAAGNLYSGRAFADARAAANQIGAEVCIISAGLGFLRSQDLVPSYDLTVSKGTPDWVLGHIAPLISEADWWARLVNPDDVRRRLYSVDGLILIAVSGPYLKMIAPVLSDLPQGALDRLRIFAGPDVAILPDNLAAQLLPYDDRLDGPQSPIRGTKSDFVSRALHHFSATIMHDRPLTSVAQQAKQVEEILNGWERPLIRSGARRSDAEIKGILRQHWDRAGGLSTKLLRVLRDDLSIACEQKRFTRLASEVRNESLPS